MGVGNGREHAVGRAEVLGQHDVVIAGFARQRDQIVVAIDKRRGAAVHVTVPDAFPFDLRIEVEERCGRRRRWIAEINRVAVRLAAEAKLEAYGFLAGGWLDGVIAAFDGTADDLRTGP